MIHCDFETRSKVDIKKAGADVYARHPSTDALCMGYCFDDGPVEMWKRGDPPPIDLLLAVEDGETVVAHNAPFELAIWNHTMVRRYKWPRLKPEQTLCTMAMSYAMAMPGSLEKAAAAAGITHQKDMAGSRIMLQLAQPRKIDENCKTCGGEGYLPNSIRECECLVWWTPEDAPEKFERLYSYCGQDIIVERELFSRAMKLSPQEFEIWLLDYKINQRGVQVDLESVAKAITLVESEKKRLDLKMREITNNAVATCTAHSQLKEWLNWNGVKVDGVDKSAVTALLQDPKLPAHCREALLTRQEAAKSSTAKLEAMRKGTCDDGRSRGLFQYHGAGTGRWAGRRIQLQNLPRPSIKQKEIDEVFEILEEAT